MEKENTPFLKWKHIALATLLLKPPIVSLLWANDADTHRPRIGLIQIAEAEAERERERKRTRWQIQWTDDYLKKYPKSLTAKATLKQLRDKLRKLESK